MDLYRIICPYCHVVHDPREYYADGFHAIVCRGCNKPFVNQTTMTPVFVSFALVGVESERKLPTMEEIEEDAKYYAEHPEELEETENQPLPISTNSVFRQCPMSKNTTYRLDGDHVEVKYKKSIPVITTRSDIHLLCEEDNPTSSIKELLGPDANTNKVAALNAVVRAVKAGLIEI